MHFKSYAYMSMSVWIKKILDACLFVSITVLEKLLIKFCNNKKISRHKKF